ncbi:LLM class flavin-dependent oxidoreductase [Streptomyces sp. NPDC060184]|uniref:LLM class flavin-dependent oxidoreductase n=1 Tax=Streptomyces sp. NPDC060184 TaxID=3347064 RepID=UPI003665A597
MSDYGHDLLFGAILVPVSEYPDDAVELARTADLAGLDLVSVPDHPYRPDLLDAWATLAVVAASTARVRVFPNVANLPLRPPAVLARTAAALDRLTGGRVELGLGAGAYWESVAADGGPRRTPGEALRATREAIEVIRALWKPGGRVRLEGAHYGLDGAASGPAPAHPIGIWVGAIGPRMLDLVGKAADGWLPSVPHVPPAQLTAGHRAVDEAAERAGRDPGAVRRLYNLSPGREGFPTGPPGSWPEQLAALTLEHGTSAFLLPVRDPGLIERFAAEVAPATRELVAAARSGAARAPGPGREAASARSRTGAAAGTPLDSGTRLSVRATEPPGERRSAERPWDETARPSAPPAGPEGRYAAGGPEAARNLVAAHDRLRADLDRLRQAVHEVRDEAKDTGEVRSAVQRLTVRQNVGNIGAFCASYCRVTTLHHTREDQDLFPHLRRADPRLGPVLDRLAEEHHAVQGVIDRLDRELVAHAGGRTDGKELEAVVDLLTDALLSHLAYEEAELIEPLARFGVGW